MESSALGRQFEREIRDQPRVWRDLAHSRKADELAAALDGEVLLVGSGSSLFVSQLGALALRRRRIRAEALAATEAHLDRASYEGRILVAVSQSGRSTDLLEAVELLQPRHLVALTNTADSPLGDRADVVIDVGAGPEVAVPASKSVSASAALLLWGASLWGADHGRDPDSLIATADTVDEWLQSPSLSDVIDAAQRIGRRRNVVVLGSEYGLPVALETALKLKEASYVHAEGFAAGEFRHGSIAMVDASYAAIGIVDEDSSGIVCRPMVQLAASEALRYTIGSCGMEGVPRLGPDVDEVFNVLAWLVTAQMLALHVARARHVESDAPRGLTKALTEAP